MLVFTAQSFKAILTSPLVTTLMMQIRRANVRVCETWGKCVNRRSKAKNEEDLIRPIHAFAKGIRRFHIDVAVIHVHACALAPVYIAHEICKHVCSPFCRADACSSLGYYSLPSSSFRLDIPARNSAYQRRIQLFLSLCLSAFS